MASWAQNTTATLPQTADPAEVRKIQNAQVNGSDVYAVINRNDIVDLSVGLKANPFGSLIIFGSAIIPLTHQGIRADVIPAVGMNYNF